MTRLQSGAVLEISTQNGLAYVQYVLTDPEYGELTRVLPGLYQDRPPAPAALAAQPEACFVFFRVAAALRRGILAPVGEGPLPSGSWHRPRMRRPGARTRDGRVTTWIIENERGEHVVDGLTPEDRQLAVIWNDTLLKQRIEVEFWVDLRTGKTEGGAAPPPGPRLVP